MRNQDKPHPALIAAFLILLIGAYAIASSMEANDADREQVMYCDLAKQGRMPMSYCNR